MRRRARRHPPHRRSLSQPEVDHSDESAGTPGPGPPSPFATARTHLCFGEWRRRGGRRIDARGHLHAALDVFNRLEAKPWSQRAEAELRAAGASIGPRKESEVRMTAQELRIAMVVAEGLTNREAAERFFVSVKTVEFHLGSVFRKLGVRSRTELARHPLMAKP